MSDFKFVPSIFQGLCNFGCPHDDDRDDMIDGHIPCCDAVEAAQIAQLKLQDWLSRAPKVSIVEHKDQDRNLYRWVVFNDGTNALPNEFENKPKAWRGKGCVAKASLVCIEPLKEKSE